jgi:hypothetical protein
MRPTSEIHARGVQARVGRGAAACAGSHSDQRRAMPAPGVSAAYLTPGAELRLAADAIPVGVEPVRIIAGDLYVRRA